MKKVIGYIHAGNKRERDRQEKAIRAYCLANEMDLLFCQTHDSLDEVVYGNFMGHSRIDAVVAASNEDITGNVFEFYALRCRLRMRNCALVVAHWTDYPGYGLHRKIFEEFTEVLARKEFENDPVLQKNGRIRNRLKGGYIGGNAPMGYRVEAGKLVVNPEEVPVVKFIMEEKHRGGTKLGTVEKLNARGYKTRKGGPFQISTVQGIWNNEELYRGKRKVGDEWVAGQHEAILKD